MRGNRWEHDLEQGYYDDIFYDDISRMVARLHGAAGLRRFRRRARERGGPGDAGPQAQRAPQAVHRSPQESAAPRLGEIRKPAPQLWKAGRCIREIGPIPPVVWEICASTLGKGEQPRCHRWMFTTCAEDNRAAPPVAGREAGRLTDA
jgi:hypothetical protein